MRYVSLFSGVEAATVAWSRLGWKPLAFAEVDEFPAAVLACRFPDVPNLGDVCEIDWEEFHERHGAVDVLIGGSPCQSFSIAGDRAGLQGESRLMFEYIRAVRELVRASGGGSPRYIIWENVPGCLSSNKGRDFGCLLDELEECGYFVAWRTLDSQFARVFDRAGGGFRGPVPQRRRRVFLVGSLGGPSAADILFERSCLRGDHPKGREAREALAEDAPGGAGVGDCAGFKYHHGSGAGSIGYGDVSPTIATDYHSPAVHYGFCQGASTSASGIGWSEECAPMLKGGESGTAQVPTVLAVRTANTGANGCGVAEEVTHTLDGANGQCVAIDYKQTPKVSEDVSHTITHEGSGGIHSAVAFVGEFGGNTGCAVTEDISPAITAKRAPSVMTQYGDVAGTLNARGDLSPCADRGQNVVCMQDGQAKGTIADDVSTTLNASHEQPIAVYGDCGLVRESDECKFAKHKTYLLKLRHTGSPNIGGGEGAMIGEDVSYTLATSQDQTMFQPDGRGYVVRRLMPVETERLQAFPDNWTDITGCDVDAVTERVARALKYERDSKECKALRRKVRKWSEGTPDTPRYKAMGNSMTTLVIELLGRRIMAYDELHYDEVGENAARMAAG